MATVKVLDSPELYTVGWIAALPIERAAATAMLDERHDKPYGFVQHQLDTNSYTWGKMGEHNVVIASLPAGLYGTTSAATTASHLLSSLPQIRIGLLVGIGGGIARPEHGCDIRLGDIVVSQPQGTTGGVIQYDLGKAKTNQRWERKDFLSMPPQVLLQALASLQAEHELEESRIPGFLGAIQRKTTRTIKGSKRSNGYVHQGFEKDRLFKSSCDHVTGHDCRFCDATEEVQRDQRDSTDPEIHYGIIASGNTLVKDAATRDKILKDIGEECICFDMEAAGLMNHFPCLVIRGICDYADSHKNDQWQRYASATAASYSKELLAYVPTRALQETQKALDVLRSVDRDIQNIQSITNDTREVVESLKLDSHLDKIKKWLLPPDTSTNLNEALNKRQQGTGSWILKYKSFQKWKSGISQFLWLHGIPGCGKTVLSATIIEDLNQQLNSSHVVLDFFFDFNNTDKQSLDKLVRSLASQLYSKCENSRKELDKLFSSYENGSRQPTPESLSTIFLRMANCVEKIQIVIDALDECKTRKDLLSWMEKLASSAPTGLQLLITSRREEEIESGLKHWLCQENHIPIQQDPVNHDIRLYIYKRLRTDREFERWRSKPSVQNEIETELMKKAGGMFRWAACQLDILQNCLDLRMLRESLGSLPKTLQETYARILVSIDSNYRRYAIRILQFLVYSDRPLTIQEAVEVIVVDPSGDPIFDPSLRMPNPRDIMKLCSSLVSLTTKRDSSYYRETFMELQLAHLSVQQFLKSKAMEEAFPNEMAKIGDIFQRGINEISARADITRVCLAYLECLSKKSAVKELEAEFPLAQYSAQYWMYHARSVETVKDVSERILNFFDHQSQVYEVWVELFGEKRWRSGNMPTPLYFASLAGLQHTVHILLKKGAVVNAQGGFYGNALKAASSHGYKNIVQLLVEKGADVNAPASGIAYGNSLQAASYQGHRDIVRLLVEKGADVNAPGSGLGGINALHAASSGGYKEIVQLLLENGADVNAQGFFDEAPLQAASYQGYKEIVQLLLENGANVNIQGMHSGSALEAASSDGHKEIVQLLLENGADVNAQGMHYGSALEAASSEGHKEIVQLLLANGADINY